MDNDNNGTDQLYSDASKHLATLYVAEKDENHAAAEKAANKIVEAFQAIAKYHMIRNTAGLDEYVKKFSTGKEFLDDIAKKLQL